MSLRELARIRNVPKRVRLIMDYAGELQTSDPEEALKAAREALRLSKQTKDYELTAMAYRSLGLRLYYAREYKEALVALGEARQIYEKKKKLNALGRTLQNIGLCYVRLGQLESALQAYTRSDELFRASNDEVNRSLVLINIAVAYSMSNNPLKAFDAYSVALTIQESRNDEYGIAVVSGNLGQMFIGMGDNDKGLQWMERCLEKHRAANNVRGVGFALRELGALHQNIGRMTVALQHFRQALTIYLEINDRNGQAEVHSLLAELHRKEQRHSVAMDHCLQARTIFLEVQDNLNVARCFHLSAEIESELGNKRTATDLLRQGISYIDRTDNRPIKAELLVSLTHNLHGKKHEAEYVRTLSAALRLSTEHQLHLLQSQIHDLLSRHYERANDLKKALNHARRAEQERSVHESQIASKQVQDLKYRVDIAQVEHDRELLRRQSEQYRLQLDSKSKELNASALSLAQKNEVISALKQRLLSAARSTHHEIQTVSRDLLQVIDEHVRGDKQMEGVTKQLSDFHQEFIAKLSSEFGDLTPTELKICSLLKLNLNTKEIADFLCVSFKSVEVYRARIRKKLHLREGDNLVSFIVAYDSVTS